MTAANYDFSVGVGGSTSIQAEGRFFYYLSGSAGGLSEKIRVKHRASGLQVSLMPGQSFELPEGAVRGDSWQVENADNQAGIIGSAIVGSGVFRDSRITGSVQIVDGGKARSMAIMGFVGGADCPVAPTGQSAQVQIWNPAASGKNLVLSQFAVSSNAQQVIYIGADNAPLATMDVSPLPKMVGGSVAGRVGQSRYATQAGMPAGWSKIFAVYVQASGLEWVKTAEPFVIGPGRGITMVTQNSATTLSAIFDFYEEPI